MAAILGVLRALALLGGLWAVLAGVAWVTGTLPPVRPVWVTAAAGAATDEESPERVPEPARVVADEIEGPPPEPPAKGTQARDDGDSIGDTPGAPPPPAALVATAEPLPTSFICEGDVPAPSVGVVDTVGDPRPELAVACGDTTFLLALRGRPLRPERVATFETRVTEAGVRASHAARPLVADVTGDALPDLVLGLWRTDARGSVRGGGLWVVPRDVSGAFATPIELADVPIVRVDALVERVGATAYLAALHRASALARRPSEVRVFAGGPAPERTETLRTGVGAVDMATADLDRDGKRDIASLAGEDPQLDVFGGRGDGRFGKLFSLPVLGGRELVALDVDGDATDDLLVLAGGLSALLMPDANRGQATPTLRELVPDGDLPDGLYDLHAHDVDGDNRRDVVGRAGATLLALLRREPFAFESPRPLVPEGFVGPSGEIASFVLGDFAIDGRADVALLFRRGPDAAWELVIVPDVRGASEARLAAEPERMADAPLSLRVALVSSP